MIDEDGWEWVWWAGWGIGVWDGGLVRLHRAGGYVNFCIDHWFSYKNLFLLQNRGGFADGWVEFLICVSFRPPLAYKVYGSGGQELMGFKIKTYTPMIRYYKFSQNLIIFQISGVTIIFRNNIIRCCNCTLLKNKFSRAGCQHTFLPFI